MTIGTIYTFAGMGGGVGNTPNPVISGGMAQLARKLDAPLEVSLSGTGEGDWQRVADAIIASHKAGTLQRPLCLIGHSKGGEAIIRLARRLAEHSIRVDYLAIIELTMGDVPPVPSNVALTHHFEATFSAVNIGNNLKFSDDYEENGGQFRRWQLVTTHIALASHETVHQVIIETIKSLQDDPATVPAPVGDGNLFERWTPVFMKMLMADFSLSVDDAAAVFGNAGHESAGYEILQEIKPVVPGSRGGYGIMQWTGPRRRAFEAYCARNGYSPDDMLTNYKWLWNELKGPEGKVLDRLRSANGLAAKVQVFSDVFLRPGIPHMASRQKWAQKALAAWQDAQTLLPAPMPPETLPGAPDANVGVLTPADIAGLSADELMDLIRRADALRGAAMDALEARIEELKSNQVRQAAVPIEAKGPKMTFDFVKPNSKTFWTGALSVAAGLAMLVLPADNMIVQIARSFFADADAGTLITVGLGLIFGREAIAKNGIGN